ncbi:MAG TPA: class I SAM-dependent methyltransferase [Candidatus Solibacter sp.]|nr:class I SAM-dependent methyltransferase [Candidatus Solibacter sp.]
MESSSPAQSDSLERIVPDELQDEGATGKATLALHLERYRFAAEHLQGGTLLDLACGVGYGTRLLADSRADLTRLTGVDLDSGAVAYAKSRYTEPRITFTNANAFEFLPSASAFDNIVSLETVEHMPDSGAFLGALVKALKPGGMLISSVPTTPSMDGNPHHLNDFTERSFRRMGTQRGLVEIASFAQRQPFDPVAILAGKEKRVQTSRRSVLEFYARKPQKLVARCWSTVRYGFENRYLTVAWKKER